MTAQRLGILLSYKPPFDPREESDRWVPVDLAGVRYWACPETGERLTERWLKWMGPQWHAGRSRWARFRCVDDSWERTRRRWGT
jgi:hypothetical protein